MKKEEMKDWEPSGIDSTNEEGMLEQLGVSMNIALGKFNENLEAVEDPMNAEPEFFYIVAANIVHKFVIGGPQIQAMDDFIASLSEEQDYEYKRGW